jgi:hypothetical protein
MNIKKIIIAISIISICVPIYTYGQIIITEIMYDPEGGDTKREWLEVFNSGVSSVDLNTYYFFENNAYHKLVAQGQSILNPGEYAIIVDSIAEVLAEYVGFIGKIFDSAFSLNNTGETISMTDSSKQITHTVTYSSVMGANNTGHSLQINGQDIITASPTFGTSNKTVSEAIEQEDDESNSSSSSSSGSTNLSGTSSHVQQVPVSNYTPSQEFKISAGRDRMTSIYTPIEFKADVSTGDVSPKFLWNFGDFTTSKGKKVTHIYEHPAVYELVVEAKSGNYTAIDRTQIKVFIPQLQIVQATSTLTITNSLKHEIHIGGFQFVFDADIFIVPRNTIIKGGETVYVPYTKGEVLQYVAYPNGEIYERFDTI